MDRSLLSAIPSLSHSQKNNLRIGNLTSLYDLLLTPPAEAAKRCRTTVSELQKIVQIVCKHHEYVPQSLEDALYQDHDVGQMFTTGDSGIDTALGGGVRTGMVWEVVGQSGAGKTQFGLQLSLMVQLPKGDGGLSGSSCYLTTSSKLPTNRLVELIEENSRLSATFCSLSNVQTLATPNIPLLVHVLSDMMPKLLRKYSEPPIKPVRLLVIDALAELFHSNDKTPTQTLMERSRSIREISSLLHFLASRYQIAIVVLNEVVDTFNNGHGIDTSSDLIYSDQSRFFNRDDSIPGEHGKEASLGLVWANQINGRIMLSRTGRRRYLNDVKVVGNKLQRVDGSWANRTNRLESAEETATVIRRLSIIFSSFVPAVSLDYIVTVEGVSSLADPYKISETHLSPPVSVAQSNISATQELVGTPLSQVLPMDAGCTENVESEELRASDSAAGPQDEWDTYWEKEDVRENTYNSADLDALLIQSDL